MRKVLIPTKLDKIVAQILGDHQFEVIQNPDMPLADMAAANPDAEAIIVRSEKVLPEVMDVLPNLKLVVRAGAGFDNIDTKYARRKNIDVMNTPGANSNSVAEEVVALILAAYRKVVFADNTTRAGQWEKKNCLGRELTGKTVGILGLGNIGRLLAKRLSGFECKILAYDPVISQELADKVGAKLCTVEEIFAQADIVSLHIPENDKTRGMVNANLISLMKKGAMLVNCARAGIVNEDDIRALKEEKQLIFCNDVYPKDAAGDKSVKDIADIMLPHLGANTKEANFNAAKRAAEQMVGYFEDGITACVVNKDVPDGLDASYQKLAGLLSSLAHAYLGGRAISQIELSCYGKLHPFSKWMMAPIVAGLSTDFDPFLGADAAMKTLADHGVVCKIRDVDDNKRYGESITLDFVSGAERLSIRGTITESKLTISRINDYENLYVQPNGYDLFVEYKDQPGVLGKIAGTLGEAGINIIDIRAPQSADMSSALAIVKTNVPVPEKITEEIAAIVNAKVAFSFKY